MALSDYSLEKKSDLTALAESIRAKVESTNSMTLAEMKAAIEGIETGGGSPTGTVQIYNYYCWFSQPVFVYYTDGSGEEVVARIEPSGEEPTELTIHPVVGSVLVILHEYDDFASNSGLLPYGLMGALRNFKTEIGVTCFILYESDYDGAWGQLEIQNY